MADIDVERKQSNSWIWWLLGLIVLGLLIWWLAAALGDDEPEVATTPLEAPAAVPMGPVEPGVVNEPVVPSPAFVFAPEMAPPVEEYLAWAAIPPNPETMGLDHEYTAEGVRRLTTALRTIVLAPPVSGMPVRQRWDQMYQNAEQLIQSPNSSLNHADIAHNTFTTSVEVMEAVQQSIPTPNPDLEREIGEARDAAMNVDPANNLLDQREAVHTFFTQAADPLRIIARMTENPQL